MLRVKYQSPELKDLVEGIIGRNFFLFANETVAMTLSELEEPVRSMNMMMMIIVPNDHKELGLAQKHTIILKIQETLEEIQKTIIHETIHLVKPWSEKTVERKTQEIYQKHSPRILSI